MPRFAGIVAIANLLNYLIEKGFVVIIRINSVSPHACWGLTSTKGVEVFYRFEIVQRGTMSTDDYDAAMRDHD